ncbi:MAG TPA: thioredoxin family protein [Bdellovibrio sp.]|nr:thioredoxin family protein [Bdellovibrio sp.]
MKTLFILILSFSISSFARLSDNKVHLKLENNQLVGRTDAGFHFNKEAPAGLVVGNTSFEPKKKELKEISFDIYTARNKKFAVNFYVCDDKNTVCEAHEYAYQMVRGKLVTLDETQDLSEEAVMDVKPTDFGNKNNHDFYLDNLPEVLAFAEREKKWVLVDFNAPWCPSCLRLETEVFGEKAFQKSTEKLLKVSINIDKAANKELSKKYDVKVIPTLILMNSKGAELARFMDYRPVDVLSKELERAQVKDLETVDDIRVKAKSGDDEARKILAERAFNATNYEEVIEWLAPLKESSLMLASAEVNVAQNKFEEDPKTREEYQKTLEKGIAAYPLELESFNWRVDLIKVMKGDGKQVTAPMKALANENILQIQAALGSSKARVQIFQETLLGDFSGFEKSELLSLLLNTYQKTDQQKKVKETKSSLMKELNAMSLSVNRTGQLLMALGYMKQAGMKSQVVDWYQKLIKVHSNSDIYYIKLARYYLNEKQYSKALPLAKKASVMKSDLTLYNLKILAEIHKGMKQPQEAAKIIEKALALPEAQLEGNQKAVAGLEELKKTLAQ